MEVSPVLPDTDRLYAALLARDPAFEGRIWVCVATTGIFCRLTCPARKPLARNCTFRVSVAECLAAGFRACKRCRPEEGTPRPLSPLRADLREALHSP
ncbi:MAG: hypothetical protein JNN02_07255, partial [Tabrizicola sp.]|nr:hypothetical protein [Tabrizicola sp.]